MPALKGLEDELDLAKHIGIVGIDNQRAEVRRADHLRHPGLHELRGHRRRVHQLNLHVLG
jgi:hypothetical protein